MSKQLLIPYNHIHILSNVVRSAIDELTMKTVCSYNFKEEMF